MRKLLGYAVIISLIVMPLFAWVAGPTTLASEVAVASKVIPAEDQFFIRGPTVNFVTNHSAMIFWRTNETTDATVRYGLNESVMESETNSTLDTDHRITLESLEIDTKYWYQVVSNGTESEIYHFLTAPADGAPFKMIVYGDTRPGTRDEPIPEITHQLAELVAAEEPHLILMPGDFLYEVPTDHELALEKWAEVTNITDMLGHYAPVYTVLGNHDEGQEGPRILEYYLDAFELPAEPRTYYSFDYAGVHFVSLDTEETDYWGRFVGEQYDWLIDDLTNDDSPLKFVMLHRPFYPVFHIDNGVDTVKSERDALQQFFEEQNVTAVFNAHDHVFIRITVNGVVHITTGGAGAPLYSTWWKEAYHHYTRVHVSPNHVSFEAIKVNSEVEERYDLPYTGHIEITLRAFPNASVKQPGSMPEILYSEPPLQTYYSWDSASNSTTLTGLPEGPGYHTLDVYAQGSDGVWAHEQYMFRAPGTTTISPPPPLDPTLPLLIIGAVGIVVVVVVIALKRKS
ncbi:MAG: metallophosphoesterase [Candidatus Thorarchaeota archaeon]|nr:MAG: metallophosphoesterase [Candidatus Thorarchaeota archaeon]